ncbi:MAG TPA: Re/Si-specific NAD(P)(+) transhydrogenase subunit alpha [bacterium]|nr:Re/Si-specific NAD(P)(+) transhydrogenase subunit alpha [bacterium]HPN44463.1 Re/Si-specific NAD(P)(+) transhydrogenase subunit alpha [bacterium]
MKIAVPKEIIPGEQRVALTPNVIGKLAKSGFEVVIETGAGAESGHPDADYQAAGAAIAASVQELYKDAQVILKVRPPAPHPVSKKHEIELYPEGAVLICFLEILRNPEIATLLAKHKVTAFSMDTVPRISRAQSMDALSSQASAAGYKAVLIAAEASHKFFPMLTTAAGTIPPAKVFVIGAGVAGLQAIATAKRLGATVEGFDIRPAAKGEVESLGAKFVQVDLGEATESGGGYAKEVSEEARKKEHEVVHQHVAAADIVITTAAVPGKKAPLLVTSDMVKAMKPGSIVVDMAVEQGGNVEGSKPGETVQVNGVKVMGPLNLPSKMSIHTSMMYAKNITTLLALLVKDKQMQIDFEDEIVKGSCITHNGEIIHEQTKKLLN